MNFPRTFTAPRLAGTRPPPRRDPDTWRIGDKVRLSDRGTDSTIVGRQHAHGITHYKLDDGTWFTPGRGRS